MSVILRQSRCSDGGEYVQVEFIDVAGNAYNKDLA